MSVLQSHLHNVIGLVKEIHSPYIAVLSFTYKEKDERALLVSNKLTLDYGLCMPENNPIQECVQCGSKVLFSCRMYIENDEHNCDWFVTRAWKLEDLQKNVEQTRITLLIGLYNVTGTVIDLDRRHGVLAYVDPYGKEHNVMFMASKVFLFSKRMKTKSKLEACLSVDDKVQFDAVPCVRSGNECNCSWFATAVWKGKKPSLEYDEVSIVSSHSAATDLSHRIKQIVSHPQCLFVYGEGIIMHILNEEYGIAFGCMKNNKWESIIFHRSACFLFKHNLNLQNIQEIFKEGDKIKFIAVPSPCDIATQWVASQISVVSD